MVLRVKCKGWILLNVSSYCSNTPASALFQRGLLVGRQAAAISLASKLSERAICHMRE